MKTETDRREQGILGFGCAAGFFTGFIVACVFILFAGWVRVHG